MKAIALLSFVLAVIGAASAGKVVCYWSSWAVYYGGDGVVTPEDLDVSLCTHINYAYVNLNESGLLMVEDDYGDVDQKGYTRITALKEKNPDLKVLISIGGSGSPSQTFSIVAASMEKRAMLVASARVFLETYGFDGVDLDWETPAAAEADNYVTLLKDFRADFDKDGWLISVMVSPEVSEGYDVPTVSWNVDHINVMSYWMYGGSWSQYTGQNSPLYASSVESIWEQQNLNVDAAITQWLEAGAAPDKLLAGIAFFGAVFTLSDPDVNGLHAPILGQGVAGPLMNQNGTWSYLEFCEAKDTWDCTWDDEQKMQYCVNGDQWLGIDNEDSILDKVAYVNSKKLAGVSIYSIDEDDVKGACGDALPLLHIIADNLD